MDFYKSAFGQNTQKALGDQARYAKQVLSGKPAETTPPPNELATGLQNPWMLMLMLLFQQALRPQPPGGADPLSAMPLPYVPGLPGGPPAKADNPAITALEKRLALATGTPPQPGQPLTDSDDVQALQSDLKAGVFDRQQLGEALMYKLAEGSERSLPALQRLIEGLSDSGDLNPTPFLRTDYLRQLPTVRQEALLSALSNTGLSQNGNKANTRLIGFILQTLANPSANESQDFVKKLLSNLQNQSNLAPNSPDTQTLQQVLSLAGITKDSQGKLVFP